MAPSASAPRLNFLNVLAFCSPGLALGSYAVAFSVFLPQYYASHIGISTAMVGNAFAIVRLIDIWLDPFLGLGMDRTRTAIGRYRPWLLIGGPVLAFASYMVFMAKPGIGVNYVILWVLVFYLGTSLMSLSQTSWAANIAPTYDARSRLFGALSAVGVVGAAIILLMPKVLHVAKSSDPTLIQTMGWFMIIAAPAGCLLASVVTREPLVQTAQHQQVRLREYWDLIKRPEVARILAADFCLALGPGWMAALYLFFFRDSRHFSTGDASLLLFVYTMAGLVGAIVLGRLATRFGKHRTLIGASTLYSLGLILLYVMPKGRFSIDGPFMFGMGFLATGFTLLVRAMVADVGDVVRLETGQNRVGLLYALVTGTQKAAGALSIFFTFNALQLVGYQTKENLHNTAAAISGMEMTYLIGPIGFVMLGGACFLGYKLDAGRHAEVRRQLEERDAMVPEAAVLEGLSSDVAVPENVRNPS